MKRNYTDPKIEITEVEGQGLFCASGSNEDFGNGPDYGKDIFDVIKPFKQPFCIAFLQRCCSHPVLLRIRFPRIRKLTR